MKLIKLNSHSHRLLVHTGVPFPLMTGRVTVMLLLALAVFCAGPVLGAGKYEVAGIDDARAAENFFCTLQRAVANNRRAEVAGLIDYPIYVRINQRSVTLRNQRELLQRYPSVFNHKIRQALANQKASNLTASWRGVMIGNGELWFSQLSSSNRFKIIAINN